MHFSWPFVLFVVLLIAACILVARAHALMVKHRVACLHQEMAHSHIRHTARVRCECCNKQGRHIVAYTYGQDEHAPRIAYVCRRCDQLLQRLHQQASSERSATEAVS